MLGLMDTDRPLQVKIDLSGKHKDWFTQIQKRHAFQSYAEVIRYMIFATWELEQSDSSAVFELNEHHVNLIKSYISRADIQDSYQVFTVNDFIREAIRKLLEEIKSSMKTILHWDVKSRLSGEEKEIAIAFAECLNESVTKEVTVEQIAQKLNKRNLEKVEQILDEFVQRDLLSREIFSGVKTYNASH
jgi:Arc/MetJ-type ribon-helix-helix transcriptional regulator